MVFVGRAREAQQTKNKAMETILCADILHPLDPSHYKSLTVYFARIKVNRFKYRSRGEWLKNYFIKSKV
jgi:hypothetical protein